MKLVKYRFQILLALFLLLLSYNIIDIANENKYVGLCFYEKTEENDKVTEEIVFKLEGLKIDYKISTLIMPASETGGAEKLYEEILVKRKRLFEAELALTTL